MKKLDEIRNIVFAEAKRYERFHAYENPNHSESHRDAHERLGQIFLLLNDDIGPEELHKLILLMFLEHPITDPDRSFWFNRSALSPTPLFSILETKDDVTQFLQVSEIKYDDEGTNDLNPCFAKKYNYITNISSSEFKRLVIDHQISLNQVSGSNVLLAFQPYEHIKWYIENTSPFHLKTQSDSVSGQFKHENLLPRNALLTKKQANEIAYKLERINSCINMPQQEMKLQPIPFLRFLARYIIKCPDEAYYVFYWKALLDDASRVELKDETQQNDFNIMRAIILQRAYKATEEKTREQAFKEFLDHMPRVTCLETHDRTIADSLQKFMDDTFSTRLNRMLEAKTDDFKRHADEWKNQLTQMAAVTVANNELKNKMHFFRAHIIDKMLRQHTHRERWFHHERYQKELIKERLDACCQVTSVRDFPAMYARSIIDFLCIQQASQYKLRALRFAFSLRERKNEEINYLLTSRVNGYLNPGSEHEQPFSLHDYTKVTFVLMKQMIEEYQAQSRIDAKVEMGKAEGSKSSHESKASHILKRERLKILFKFITTPLENSEIEMTVVSFVKLMAKFTQITRVLHESNNVEDQRLASLLIGLHDMSNDFKEMYPGLFPQRQRDLLFGRLQSPSVSPALNAASAANAAHEKDRKHVDHNSTTLRR